MANAPATVDMKPVKMIALIVVGFVILAAAGYSLFNVKKEVVVPVLPRPIEQVAVLRSCDFISISGFTNAVCEDRTQWSVTEIPVVQHAPAPLPVVEPDQPADVPIPESRGSDIIEEVFAVQSVAAAEVEPESAVEPVPVVVAPEPVVVAAPAGTAMQVRYSHYWPPLGGTNCFSFVNGVCISAMASGQPWAPYVGTAVACPKEWAFGTTVELDGRVWTCMDRGSAIKYVDGVPWIDFLEATGRYVHGSIVAVHVVHP